MIGDGNGGESEEVLNKGYHSGNVDTGWVKQSASNPYLKQDILNFYIYLYKNFNETGDYNKITDKDNNSLKKEDKNLEENEEKAQKEISQSGDDEKNQVSHRANALKIFNKKLKEAGYADK